MQTEDQNGGGGAGTEATEMAHYQMNSEPMSHLCLLKDSNWNSIVPLLHISSCLHEVVSTSRNEIATWHFNCFDYL